MRGIFFSNPPKPKYTCTCTLYIWDVSKVEYQNLYILYKVYQFEELTLKTSALIAFNNSTESTNFNISGFRFYGDFIVFSIKDLMKTTRPGHSMQKVKTNAFTHEKLCNEILYIKNRTKTSF